jgi:predicted phage tail protein
MAGVRSREQGNGGWVRRALTAAAAMLLGTSTVLIAAIPTASASPNPSVDSSPTSPTTATPLEWSFSNASPASCELTEGATTISALADCTSPADFDVSADAGGSYTFTVYGAAAADVVVGTTPSATSTVDVAPVAPTITSSPTSPNNDPTPSWQFTLPTGATATCELDDPANNAVQTDGACTSPFTASDLTSAPANGVNGTYSLSVTPTAGGVSGQPATSTYDFNTATPSAPDVSADASTGFSLHPTFSVSGVTGGASLSCTVTGPSSGPAVAVQNCGATSTLDLTGGDDGTYTLSVTQTYAGNVSPAGSATYLLDTHTPATPSVSAPASPGGDLHPNFTVTGIESGATAVCSVSGPSSVTVATCGPSTVLDLSSGSDGIYTVQVRARDAAGMDSAPASATYELESAGPSAPAITGPSGPANDRSPSFSVTDSDPVDDLSYVCAVTGPSAVATSSCGPTTTINLSAAGDGTYTLSVSAVDGLDHLGPASTTTYTLDTTPPPVPTVTAPQSLASDTSPSFTVNEPDGAATLSCTVSGPTVVPASAITCGPTTTVDLSGAGRDGTYKLSVTATDAEGNTSAAGTATYTLDTTPPPVPTIVAPPSPSNDLSPTFDIGDSESGVTLSCTLTDPNNQTLFTGPCPSDGAFDTSGDAADGDYQLVVTASDSAGNQSSAGAPWTRDTQAPPAPVVGAPLSPSNQLVPFFSISDTEAGVALTCNLTGPGAVVAYTGLCPVDGLLNLAGFGDGLYTLSVTATDDAGNISLPGVAIYTVDTTPPPVPIVTLTAPVLSPGNVTHPQFSLSDTEMGVTFSCSVTGPTSVPASAVSCGPTTTVDLSGAGRDGVYTLSVTAADAAGNPSAAATATYTLDTSAPPNPSVVAPPSPSNDITPTFTVSDSEPGVVFGCVLTGPGSTTVFSNLCPASRTFDLVGFGDGTYLLTVTATDPAGNVAPATASASYVLDTTPPPSPNVSLSTPASSPANLSNPQFAVSDTEPGVTFSCSVTGPTSVPASAVSCGPTTTLDLSGSGRDGSYTLSVTATDAAGNTSAAGTATYVLDTAAPPVPTVTLTSPASSPGSVTHPQFSVNDTEAGVTLTCSVSGATSVPASAVSCGPTATVDLSGGGLDGSYTLSVTATDAAGNTSVAGTATYVLDTAAPPVPTVTLTSPASSPGSVTHPQFSVNDTEAGVTLTCSVSGPTSVPASAVTCGPTTTVNLSGAGRDGAYTLSVTATDAAGNASSAATATYTLDTTPPPAPSVVLTSPASSPSSTVSPSFSVNDTEAGVTLTCSVTGATSVPASAVSCGPTTTVDLSGAGRDGAYTVSVTATDAAGNTSVAGTATYVLDTAAPPVPTVTLTSPASSPGNVTHPQFSVNDTEAGVTFSCSVTGATSVPASAVTCGSTTTVDLSGAGRDGSYTLSVTATDAAGNTSTAATATYILDTTAPPAPGVVVPPPMTKTPVFGISDGDPTATLTCLLLSPRGRTVFPSAPPGVCPPSGGFDTTGFADGSYTLTVTATDPAGNVTVTTVNWVRDTTPPPVPVVTLVVPASSPGKVTQPQFGITDTEAGVTLACSVTGPTTVPASAINCGPTTTVDLGGAGRDGVYTVSVTATDAAGNTSVAGTVTYTLDTIAPPAPTVTLTSPASSPGKVTHPQFSVNDTEAGVTFTCSVTGPSSVPASAVSCGSTTSVDLSGTGRDGVYTVSVTATDVAGNSSPAGTAPYLLDTTAPPMPYAALTYPVPTPSNVGNVTDPQFSVTDSEAGVGFNCSVTGPTSVPSSAISCGATTTVSLAGANRDGVYTLSVTATDQAGNTSAPWTVVYQLDTTPPKPPVIHRATAYRSSSNPPLWIWQFDSSDAAFNLDTVTCTVTGPSGPQSSTVVTSICPHYFRPTLQGDGQYQLTVTLTDEAGNSTSATGPPYYLDSRAPGSPSIWMVNPRSSIGLTRHPVWHVSGPANTRLWCKLWHSGKPDVGSPVVSEACPTPATFSLVGMQDGLYTLSVTATDSVGNTSGEAAWTYTLQPRPPDVAPPNSQNPTAVWSVQGDPGDTYVCTLSDSGGAIVGPKPCDGHPTFDMSGRAPGQYTLSVYAIDDQGVQGQANWATWTWDGIATPPPPSPPGGNTTRHHHPLPSTSGGGQSTGLPSVVKKLINTPQKIVNSVVGSVPPSVRIIPDRLSQAVQHAVQTVGSAGGAAGFPLILLGLLLGFLLVQNRIDRRDPKLALATIAADDTVDFQPPPSQEDRP